MKNSCRVKLIMLLASVIAASVTFGMVVAAYESKEAVLPSAPTEAAFEGGSTEVVENLVYKPCEFPDLASIDADEFSEESPSFVTREEIPLEFDYQFYLYEYCKQYGVPYSLGIAIVEKESRFDEKARNGRCYGLMQISTINASKLADEIGVYDLSDPVQNLHAGVYMISELYGKYGGWEKALMCYNMGEGGAKRKFAVGVTSTKYSRSVLTLSEKWEGILDD